MKSGPSAIQLHHSQLWHLLMTNLCDSPCPTRKLRTILRRKMKRHRPTQTTNPKSLINQKQSTATSPNSLNHNGHVQSLLLEADLTPLQTRFENPTQSRLDQKETSCTGPSRTGETAHAELTQSDLNWKRVKALENVSRRYLLLTT